MHDQVLEEVLADASLYLKSGSADAAFAAVEMIAEAAADLASQAQWAHQALMLVDQSLCRLAEAGDQAVIGRTLNVFFSLAARVDPEVARVEPAQLAIYCKALLASGSSAMPARRVARHASLQMLFSMTRDLDGWVAECGCAAGLSFLQLCFVEKDRRPLWRGEDFQVFDSFEGLSPPVAQDLDVSGMEAKNAQRVLSMTSAGNMAFDRADVSARILGRFPAVEIHAGWLPQSLLDLPERRYRFVHVDVDLYQPTLGCFAHFYPRLVPGGIIVTDDYNWPGGRRAVDEYCASQGLTPRLTSTNQAYLVAA